MDGHDQNIPLVTDTGSGFYRSAFFKIKSHTCLHKLPHLRWSKAVHIRDGLVQPKIYKVKGFHQTMGLKNAILWGSTDDPVYDILLNDWYQSGLYEKAILKAQSRRLGTILRESRETQWTDKAIIFLWVTDNVSQLYDKKLLKSSILNMLV